MKKPFLISDIHQMEIQHIQLPKNLGGIVDFIVIWADNEDEALNNAWRNVFSDYYGESISQAEFYEFFGAYEVKV